VGYARDLREVGADELTVAHHCRNLRARLVSLGREEALHFPGRSIRDRCRGPYYAAIGEVGRLHGRKDLINVLRRQEVLGEKLRQRQIRIDRGRYQIRSEIGMGRLVRSEGPIYRIVEIVNATSNPKTLSLMQTTFHCAKTVPESNVFSPFELSFSEKQIPRFVGNVSS